MATLAMATLRRLCLPVLLASIFNTASAADRIEFQGDGWYSWRFASVEPGMEETVFVEIASGAPREIEIDGRWCNRRRHEPAVDLGMPGTDASIDWLQQQLAGRSELHEDALAAISRHAGDRALQVLISIVASDTDHDARQQALFWMAVSESAAAFAYINGLLMAE